MLHIDGRCGLFNHIHWFDRQWFPAGPIEQETFTLLFFQGLTCRARKYFTWWLILVYCAENIPVNRCATAILKPKLWEKKINYLFCPLLQLTYHICIFFATDLSYLNIFCNLPMYHIWTFLQLTYHICTIVSKGPTRCNVAHARILHGGWPAVNLCATAILKPTLCQTNLYCIFGPLVSNADLS